MTIYNHNRPRVGDAVWVEGMPQPNGKIVKINYHGADPELMVRFHDLKVMFYSQDRFLGNRDRNVWMIYAEEHEDLYDENAEDRLDVMILFDLTPKDAANLPRLLFLCKYFNYTDPRYKHGCERRREQAARLVGTVGCETDWAEHGRLMGVYHTGRAINARLRGQPLS